jgi:hypothetical protein
LSGGYNTTDKYFIDIVDATEHLPRKKDGAISGYALGIAAQNAHRFERPQLLEGMEACLNANVRLVTSHLDH